VLDTRVFHPADDAAVTVHVVCGRIRYDAGHLRRLGWKNVTGPQTVGRLVWIKRSCSRRTAVTFASTSWRTEFPQQTTADQWYDESQFESYRKLGELSGRAAFCPATSPSHSPLACAPKTSTSSSPRSARTRSRCPTTLLQLLVTGRAWIR